MRSPALITIATFRSRAPRTSRPDSATDQKANSMPQVETVLGPIDADSLGVTLSHEHVFVVMGEDNHHYPWMFDLDATLAKAIGEVGEAKAGGIDTIIDLT